MRSLLATTIEDEADVTIVDMEAGLEHLSRSGGTLAYADVLLMVMEPTRKSILTAGRTRDLAEELGIPAILGVGNKARLPDDEVFFRDVCKEYGVELAGVIPFDAAVEESDRRGTALAAGHAPDVRAAIAGIVDAVEAAAAQKSTN